MIDDSRSPDALPAAEKQTGYLILRRGRRPLGRVWGAGPVTVLGAQWGDEGKGKIVDRLAGEADLVIRFNGGANAGHTIVTPGGTKYATHLLPSGIVRPGKKNLVGPGVVCSLDVLRDELEIADANGAQVLLDRSAPVVTMIHRWFDRAREGRGGIGTTGRGIGPAYEDLAARRTVRLGDLTSAAKIRAALTANAYYDERAAAARAYGGANLPPFPTLDEVVNDLLRSRELVLPRLCDGLEVAWDAIGNDQRVLFEGAQGVMLDVFFGSSPHTTSSLCTASGIAATFGGVKLGRVIGIAKAYVTRVGDGPFPTELKNETGDRLRELGGEYGATTGRPRRCGWLDLLALRYAVRAGGITDLVVTKMDTLSRLDEVPLVATDYVFEGRPVRPNEKLTSRILREAEVGYASMPAWEDPSAVRMLEDLPGEAREYLKLIEQATNCPVLAVGTGAGRDALAV